MAREALMRLQLPIFRSCLLRRVDFLYIKYSHGQEAVKVFRGRSRHLGAKRIGRAALYCCLELTQRLRSKISVE